MKAVLQVAAGIAVGIGLVALAGANLRSRGEGAPAPTPASAAAPVANAPAPAPAPQPEPAAWRSRARPPDEVPPGVLAGVARRVADREPPCTAAAPAPAGNVETSGSAGGSARCRPGDVIESVEIDWHAASTSP